MSKKEAKPRRRVDLVPLSREQLRAIAAIALVSKANADIIVAQIIAAVKSGATKPISAGAFDEWEPKLLKHIKKVLSLGGVWDAATAAKVLQVASDMGLIASILAGNNSSIAKAQIHAAFRAVKGAHTTCSSVGMGGGPWCEFIF